MTADESGFNGLDISAIFGSVRVLVCRRCGALVPVEPVEYANQHSAWHQGLEYIIETLDAR